MRKALRVFFRVLRMSLRSLWAFRLRSLFVISATALGIASLTIIVASVDGAQKRAREITEFFGPDAVFVLGGDVFNRSVGMRTNTLTWNDVRQLRRSLPGAYLVVPMRGKGGLTGKAGNKKADIQMVVGATANYAESWNWPLEEGRDFSREDVDKAARVTILGDMVSKELFGDESPVGRSVLIGKVPFVVVGKLIERGLASGGGGGSVDNRAIVPITTLTRRFNLDRNFFRALRVKFHTEQDMAGKTENLRSFLRHLHGLGTGEKDDFTLITADQVLKFLSMIQGGLVAFLGVTASVAILVGGFVLANLFYLSVTERRSEIGLRRAFGARSNAILVQFLGEAVLLTILGALLGLALGMGMAQVFERLDVLEIELSWKIFFIAMASSVVIGLLFGLRPARSAARLDPIEALRS
jgi:putative ABC transport system permease protein